MQGFKINGLDLGASWVAVLARRRGGPLVLVQASKGPQSIQARLDLDKRSFIDPTPFESRGRLVDALVDELCSRSVRR